MMRTTLNVTCLCLLLSTVGCAFNNPDGPAYSKPPAPPEGKSQLVVFRPVDGWDRTFSLSVAGEHKTDMLNGGFSTLTLPPGTHVLETDINFSIRAWLPGIIVVILPIIIYQEMAAPGESSLSVELGLGETRFVRFVPGTSSLELVDGSGDASSALTECRSQDD